MGLVADGKSRFVGQVPAVDHVIGVGLRRTGPFGDLPALTGAVADHGEVPCLGEGIGPAAFIGRSPGSRGIFGAGFVVPFLPAQLAAEGATDDEQGNAGEHNTADERPERMDGEAVNLAFEQLRAFGDGGGLLRDGGFDLLDAADTPDDGFLERLYVTDQNIDTDLLRQGRKIVVVIGHRATTLRKRDDRGGGQCHRWLA